MFVSYALSAGFSLRAFCITCWIRPSTGILGYFIAVVSATVLVAP